MVKEKGFKHLSPDQQLRVVDIATRDKELIPEHSHDFVRVSVSGAQEIGGLHRTFTYEYGHNDIEAGEFDSRNPAKIIRKPDSKSSRRPPGLQRRKKS